MWLRLEGIAETPISLPRRAEAGNLYEALPEITGTAMRGSFAKRYMYQQGWDSSSVPKDSEGTIFEALFENFRVRYGPLRPLPNGFPSSKPLTPMPIPRSARSCKYNDGFADEHGVIDGLLFQASGDMDNIKEEMRKCPVCSAPLEALEKEWMIAEWNEDLSGGVALDYDPEFHLSTHVGMGPAGLVDADLSDEGRLFSLQHFPAGTTFRGWIAIGDPMVDMRTLGLSDVGEEHAMILRVGRRSKSYGGLKVWISNKSPRPPWEGSHNSLNKRFSEFQTTKEEIKSEKLSGDYSLLALTCLTDLILLDRFLRPCRSITACQIADYLCVDYTAVKQISSLTATRVIGGWNAAHRLPKENDCAIVAGSVFLFAVYKDSLGENELAQRLTELENSGIGWRRSEGFGQVLICDPFHIQAEKRFQRLNGEEWHRPAVKLNKLCFAKKEEQLTVTDELVWNFLKTNMGTFHKNRRTLTKTQLNGLLDHTQRYHRGCESDESRRENLRTFLERALKRSKPGCWDLEVKGISEGKKPLAKVLIELLGLEKAACWETVRTHVGQFVKGAVAIVSLEDITGSEREGTDG